MRELFIAVDRAATVERKAGARELTPEMLPPPLAAEPAPAAAGAVVDAPAAPAEATLDQRKRAEIAAAYRAQGFDASKTAKALGVGRSTFYRWVEKYGLK